MTPTEVCTHPRCQRPAELNPPYCCVPCEVNAGSPGHEHMHSVTCQRNNPATPDA